MIIVDIGNRQKDQVCFEGEHGSWRVGPEFGKVLGPGRILYLKPGWGVDLDEDEGDRKWSFEVGFRYFMD